MKWNEMYSYKYTFVSEAKARVIFRDLKQLASEPRKIIDRNGRKMVEIFINLKLR